MAVLLDQHLVHEESGSRRSPRLVEDASRMQQSLVLCMMSVLLQWRLAS